jgi:hypothetical protein
MTLVEMHVQGRADAIAKLVLDLGQSLRQIANVVVIDECEGRERGNAALHLRPDNLAANEISKKLRASDPSLVHDDVEVLEQRSIHRHAEANEVGLHGTTLPDLPSAPAYSFLQRSTTSDCE